MIWGKQILRKLKRYKDQIKAVLGENWDEQEQGRELKNFCNRFESKLENHLKNCTQKLQEMKHMKNIHEDQHSNKNIFTLQKHPGSDTYKLSVQFDDNIVTLFKEIRNFKWMQVKTPTILKFKAEQAV